MNRYNSRSRIIILLPDDEDPEPYETPTEQIIDGIRQGFYEAFTRQTVPLAKMWECTVMINSLFVDTSGWASLFITREPQHLQARQAGTLKGMFNMTENEADPDDTPIAEIRESIYQGWQDALAGRTKPISQLWQGLDIE